MLGARWGQNWLWLCDLAHSSKWLLRVIGLLCWWLINIISAITSYNSLAKLFVHSSQRSSSKAISKNSSSSPAEIWARRSWRIVVFMLGHLHLSPVGSVYQIISIVAQWIDVLGSQKTTYFWGFILLLQILAFSWLFIFKIEYVESSTSLIGITNLEFFRLSLDFCLLSFLLFFHVFPSLKIPFVFLNPSGINNSLFLLVFQFPLFFLMSSKVLVKPIIFSHEMRWLLVRIIDKNIVYIFIEIPNPIS